jgi:hypothetical protein
LEQALDLFVYAPLGLALTAQEELPRLVEKGRQRVTGQVQMARMIGQFAVSQGQREAEKAVKQATSRLSGLGARPSAAGAGPSGSSAGAAPRAASAPARAASSNGAATVREEPARSTPPVAPDLGNGGGVPPVDHLAIPGYDSLSASQVVQRLAGLSGEELAAVARYEAATRHRKTILTRVAQLQSV